MGAQQLSAAVDDALVGVAQDVVRRHLSQCEECALKRARYARASELLQKLLTHDPGAEHHEKAVLRFEQAMLDERKSRTRPATAPPAVKPAAAPAPAARATPGEDPLADLIRELGEASTRSSAWPEDAPAPSTPPRPAEPASGPPESAERRKPQAVAPHSPAPATPAGPAPGARDHTDRAEHDRREAERRDIDRREEERRAFARREDDPEPPAHAPEPIPHSLNPHHAALVGALVACIAVGAIVVTMSGARFPRPTFLRHTPAPTQYTRESTPPTPTPATIATPSPARQATLPPAPTRAAGSMGVLEGTPAKAQGAMDGGATSRKSDEASAPMRTIATSPTRAAGSMGVLEGTPAKAQGAMDGGATSRKSDEAARKAAEERSPQGHSSNPARQVSQVTGKPAEERSPQGHPSNPARQPSEAPATDDEDNWKLICGAILDDQGQPVAGAKVLLADLDLAARTDRRGRFCLSAPPGERTLSVVALGFASKRQVVSLAEQNLELTLTLAADN